MAAIDNKNASGSMRLKGSRLSLRNQKQLSDISPAPVPRSSHRIRTLSSESEEKTKNNASSRRTLATTSTSTSVLSENLDQEHRDVSAFNGFVVSGRAPGICPLANLGNTCFLNSVLYALRFLPGFVHDLHHLYSHLQRSSDNVNSSLSQRINFLHELHNVFTYFKEEESSCSDSKRIPALHPLKFLDSVRSVNAQFEGNRQQDAHELLHCLLDQLFNLPQDLLKSTTERKSEVSDDVHSPKHKRRRRTEKQSTDMDSSKIFDVVGSKFVGQMLLETRCVECEQTNSREENFLEVCVPVKTKMDLDDDEEFSDTEVLLMALCKEEGLVGSNKYWCDFCCHHNEAERSVHYQRLPHNLLIHIKRFSSYTRTFASKCCDAMPAPFQLPCFCQECLLQQKKGEIERESVRRANSNHSSRKENLSSLHLPYFLTAFVCHLGATISSGHYISFVNVRSQSLSSCLEKEYSKNLSLSNSNIQCSFLSCCASHLDHILPSGTMNGHCEPTKNASKLPPHKGIWLECDDEKIKVVSYTEVSAAMKSNHLTPYLLFYSR